MNLNNIGFNDKVEIVDVLGKTQPVTFVNRSANSLRLNIEKLSIGIYLLKTIAPNGKQQCLKWVKEWLNSLF